MMKIGVIQLFGNLNVMGLGDFFNAHGVDWRLLYCPFSLNDAMIENIHLDNIGKTFAPGWHFERCMDYHEIRIINESWREHSTTVEQRVKLICDWVGACDFTLLDITGCLHFAVEKSWPTIEGVLKTLNADSLLCFVFDWRPKASARRQWDEKLIRLQNTRKTVFVDSAYIEKLMLENGIRKSDLSKWMYFNQELYNAEIQNTLRTNIETLWVFERKKPCTSK